ncbi:MAG: hypothetical protein ABSE73_04890 [Planctomycetota bacterium]
MARYSGEVVYLFAFDIAYEIPRGAVKTLLGQPAAEFVVDDSKRSPKQLFFHRPEIVRLPAVERAGPRGTVRVERTVKMLPVGAISIAVKVPFEVERLEDLVAYHDLQLDKVPLHDEVHRMAEQVRKELEPVLYQPVQKLADEEAYTVFCFKAPLAAEGGGSIAAGEWLAANRRGVAALLMQEEDAAAISEQESLESTARHLSYYNYDLVVTDWDAAVIVDEPQHWDQTLYLMEVANVQLAELEAYDRLLDDAIERAYRDLTGRMRSRRGVLQELRRLKMDLARLSDELSNTTKFIGEYHLARVYDRAASIFHLADWHRTVAQKVSMLDELYQILSHDLFNWWMFVLEVSIVILFVLDLVLLVLVGGGKK